MSLVAALLGGTGRHQLHHQTTTRTAINTSPEPSATSARRWPKTLVPPGPGGGAFPSSCYWLWWRSLSVWLIRLCWRFLRLLFSRDHASSAANPTLARHPLSFEVPLRKVTMFKKKS
jgi:hypothetical protein